MTSPSSAESVPPRIGQSVTITGTVRTVESIWPEGHYRITLDVDTNPAYASPGSAKNPVNGVTDDCPAPGYIKHIAVGAGAISPPYLCHGCSTWFVLPDDDTSVTAPGGQS